MKVLCHGARIHLYIILASHFLRERALDCYVTMLSLESGEVAFAVELACFVEPAIG